VKNPAVPPMAGQGIFDLEETPAHGPTNPKMRISG